MKYDAHREVCAGRSSDQPRGRNRPALGSVDDAPAALWMTASAGRLPQGREKGRGRKVERSKGRKRERSKERNEEEKDLSVRNFRHEEEKAFHTPQTVAGNQAENPRICTQL